MNGAMARVVRAAGGGLSAADTRWFAARIDAFWEDCALDRVHGFAPDAEHIAWLEGLEDAVRVLAHRATGLRGE